MKIVALLESMWAWRGYNEPDEESPRFYRINPQNHSGRRLYKICGDANLIVTNCCRYVQRSANHHGEPDLEWTRENLQRAIDDGANVILICGKVASDAFMSVVLDHKQCRFYLMDHPAARRWTNEKLDNAKVRIASYAAEVSALSAKA